jgi:hypothetical protein
MGPVRHARRAVIEKFLGIAAKELPQRLWIARCDFGEERRARVQGLIVLTGIGRLDGIAAEQNAILIVDDEIDQAFWSDGLST